ncbi:MAG: (2Fe-2S)-binding protein, partial [Cyanobacteria bacterium HKST-UBA05]|nr:(2Fe-2S)-binding protein [Cyanobacteria bacterium HKST-UBA05]
PLPAAAPDGDEPMAPEYPVPETMTGQTENGDPTICFCFGIRQSEIMQAILTHQPANVADLTAVCKAGNGCTSCWPELQEMIESQGLGG